MINHEIYMRRCIALAKLAAGNVAPNPMVGAVLVHEGRIIGEGYHQKYGESHAEPNCIASVHLRDRELISSSTLYVSLEPCAHYGKTPPCTELIIRNKIPKVVIGCRDPFGEVNGKGIGKLKTAGVDVLVGLLEKECRHLNKRFLLFQEQHRPYIILKWAQTANGKLAGRGAERLIISNEFTNRLVHKWRTEEASVLVGTNTALKDNPQLTTRLWPGNNPARLVVDMDLKLPHSLEIFKGRETIVVYNRIKHEETGNIIFYQVSNDASFVQQVANSLYRLKIQSVIVEGGARLLQSFIDEGMWDEARIIENGELITDGLDAPKLTSCMMTHKQKIFGDTIITYTPLAISTETQANSTE